MNKKDPKYVYNGLLNDGVRFLQHSFKHGFSITEICEYTGIPEGEFEKFLSFKEPMDHQYYLKFNGFCGMILEETSEKEAHNPHKKGESSSKKYNVLLAEGIKLLDLKFPVSHLSQKMDIERSYVKTMLMNKIPVTRSFYENFAKIYEIEKLRSKGGNKDDKE